MTTVSPNQAGAVRELRSRWLGWLSALVILLLTLISLRYPPIIGSDFTEMCRAWDYFIRTGEFNRIPTLNPQDIAQPTSEFVTWWSPGVQILAGLPELCGIPLGWSITFWLGVTALLSLWGTRKLYLHLGFGEQITAVALLAWLCGWHSLYAFRQFPGAEPFAAALIPWLCVAMLKLAKQPFAAAILLCAMATVGTLIKLSFFIAAAAAATASILVAIMSARSGRTSWRHATQQTAALGISLLIALGIIQVSFLSHGATPATGWATDYSIGQLVHAAAMAIVLPLSSVFALVSIGGRLCEVAGWPHIEDNPLLLAFGVIITLFAYVFIWRSRSDQTYRAWLLGGLIVYVTAFTRFYYLRAAVSYEDRHFRPVALILLPGIVACAMQSPSRLTRVATTALLILAVGWGIASYVDRLAEIATRDQLSYRHYSLRTLPAAVDRALRELDTTMIGKEFLFCSSEPEALLAIRHHRAIRLPPTPSQSPLHGHVARVALVLPPHINPATVEASFVDHETSEWYSFVVTGWTICSTVKFEQ